MHGNEDAARLLELHLREPHQLVAHFRRHYLAAFSTAPGIGIVLSFPPAYPSWFPSIDPVATARGSDALALDRLESEKFVFFNGGVTNGS